LLSITCTAPHWILFRTLVSSIVTGREYIIDGTYVLWWKMRYPSRSG
jgi:hypothetical protein